MKILCASLLSLLLLLSGCSTMVDGAAQARSPLIDEGAVLVMQHPDKGPTGMWSAGEMELDFSLEGACTLSVQSDARGGSIGSLQVMDGAGETEFYIISGVSIGDTVGEVDIQAQGDYRLVLKDVKDYKGTLRIWAKYEE